ncbi:MAG: creatininase family protein [Planctomycetaceae bacterium]|nr:creatininase family protein [Planctomycetaceae bacterium]
MEYHMTRPRELAAQRRTLPVAYLGLGILEWHGKQNPLGLDGVKAHAVGKYMSEKVGGVAVPPLFWGDHRGEIAEVVFDRKVAAWLPEGIDDHATEISQFMGLSRRKLADEGKRCAAAGGWRLWKELVEHIFFELESLEFKMIMPYPGHYPLIGPLHEAVESYKAHGGTCRTFILMDQLVHGGDHAAKLETSMLMYLTPGLVDLSQLSEADTFHLGVLGEDPLKTASADFGREILEGLEKIVREQTKDLR